MKNPYLSFTILLLLISFTFQQSIDYGNGGSTGYGGAGSSPNEEFQNNMENQESQNGETIQVSPSSGGVIISTEAGETATISAENGETMSESGEGAAVVGETGEAEQPQTTTPHTVFPPSTLNTWIVDIHYLSGRGLNTSHPSFHYCFELSPGFVQCDLYNGTDDNSRLLGVELVVTKDILLTFDVEERKLWYPHAFEVLNGFVVIPNLSPDQELEVMKVLVNTYAKTTAFYPKDPNFPIGAPQVAYGWVTDQQVNETLAQDIDQLLNLTTTFQQRREARQGLQVDDPIEGLNSWEKDGESPQYQVFTISVNTDDNEPL